MSGTAIFYLGQARTFAHCWANQWDIVLRHYPDARYYVCVEDDAQADGMLALMHQRVSADRIAMTRLKTPPDLPCPPESAADHVPYARSGDLSKATRNLVNTLWGFNEAWEWYKRQPQAREGLIVRLRPDSHFHAYNPPPFHELPVGDHLMSLWWSRCGGVNDRFALMGRTAARAYLTTYTRLQALIDDGVPFHGERFIAASLASQGIRVSHTLDAWLSLIRMPNAAGQMGQVWPAPEAREVALFARGL